MQIAFIMRTIFLLLLLSGVLVSCKPQSKPASRTIPPTSSENTNFKKVFARFLAVIQTADADTFNQFIHPDYNLHILEQPGAVPQFTKVTDIYLFKMHFSAKPFFSIRQELSVCNLQEEVLPTFNCEGQVNNPAGYNKQGCFVADAQAFQKNPAHLYAGLSNSEKQQIAEIKKLLSKTVLHTGTGYQFHWGNIQGQWYVLFIQLITPCSA